MLNFRFEKDIKLLAKKKIVLKQIFYKNNLLNSFKTPYFKIDSFLNPLFEHSFKKYIFTLKKKQKTFFFKNKFLFNNKNKTFLKAIFLKNISNFEISFYLRKMILSLLSYYNLQIKRINYLIETSGSEDLILFLYKKLINIKILFNIKTFLYLLKTRIILKTKEEFLIQKRVLFFFIKKNRKIINIKKRFLFFNLIVSFLKLGKVFNFNKKLFLKHKKLIANDFLKKKSRDNKNSFFYKKFVGMLLKNGAKNKAIKLVQKSFYNICNKLKISLNLLIYKLFNRLKTPLEIKKIKIRRSYHFVPLPVNFKRKIYLSIKWIILSVKKSKIIKESFCKKLQKEIIGILLKKNSLPIKKKKYMLFKSLQNKSNLHYRW